MTNSSTTTYTLSTRYGIEETFSTLVGAKQWMCNRGEALVWERYEDCNGVFFAGFAYGDDSNDPIAIIR
jgi:hypothetical protein